MRRKIVIGTLTSYDCKIRGGGDEERRRRRRWRRRLEIGSGGFVLKFGNEGGQTKSEAFNDKDAGTKRRRELEKLFSVYKRGASPRCVWKTG